MPKRPSSFICSTIGSGNESSWSYFSALGRICSSANWRTISVIACCSSVRSVWALVATAIVLGLLRSEVERCYRWYGPGGRLADRPVEAERQPGRAEWWVAFSHLSNALKPEPCGPNLLTMAADRHSPHMVARAARWPLKDPLTDELELDHRTPAELAAQLAAMRSELATRPPRNEVAAVAAEAVRRELNLLRNRVLPDREREIADLRAEIAELSRARREPVVPREEATPPPGVGALLTLATRVVTARDLLGAM